MNAFDFGLKIQFEKDQRITLAMVAKYNESTAKCGLQIS
jgi:hypothetical protein